MNRAVYPGMLPATETPTATTEHMVQCDAEPGVTVSSNLKTSSDKYRPLSTDSSVPIS